LSFRRKPEFIYFKTFWTPAFAGVTIQLTFYEAIKHGIPENVDGVVYYNRGIYFSVGSVISVVKY